MDTRSILAPPPPPKPRQLSLMLTHDLADLLKRLSDQTGLSQSELARRLIQSAAEQLLAASVP